MRIKYVFYIINRVKEVNTNCTDIHRITSEKAIENFFPKIKKKKVTNKKFKHRNSIKEKFIKVTKIKVIFQCILWNEVDYLPYEWNKHL